MVTIVKRLPAPVLLCSLALLTPLLLHSEESAQKAIGFQTISDVVEHWSPDQHLWVYGNIGVAPDKLSSLESWLDKNGPNWTIVLMQNASSQRYDGRSGMNAVEYALGEGLSNRTTFGDLVDSRTGEPNGAVFVLFLEERKFSYFASEVFDNRGLGERYWVGRLDKPAINAMRNGGRISDAVKDTVSSVETALTRNLEDEAERKRLAEIERQRAISEALHYPEQLLADIEEAETRAAALRSSHAGLIGPIVRPNSSAWRAEVQTIARLAQQKDATNARKHFTDTTTAIANFTAGLDQWKTDARRFIELGSQIRDHPSPDKAPSVAGRLAAAKAALDSAEKNHASGELLYREQLATAERSLDEARAHFAAWQTAEARKRMLIRIVSILALLGLIVFLTVANRLRRPAKKEALDLFREWEGKLKGKFDELFSLMDRTSMVVGGSLDLDERGYQGTTEALARKAIREVDELFIMSSATDRVVDEVESLVLPRSGFARLFNTFSSRNYRRANDLLTSTPIGFDRQEHLETILNPPTSTEKKQRSLLGETGDYQPFRISFQKLVEEYDSRQAEARVDISRLEAGIDGLPLTQQQLVASLESTSAKANRLAALAIEDNLFPLVSLRQELIPKTAATLEAAAGLGKTDPIAAFETIVPEGERLATESLAMANTVEAYREVDKPVIESAVEQLSEAGHSVSWVDQALGNFILRTEALGRQAVAESIVDKWVELDDDLTCFRGAVVNCESLSRRIREDLEPKISAGQAELESARLELSSRLSLEPSETLHEPGLTPDEKLELSRTNVKTALAAIGRGHYETAQKNVVAAEDFVEEAGSLISLSRESADKHVEIHGELSKARLLLLDEAVPVRQLQTEMETGYAPSVLLFSSRFGEEVSGQQSIVDCIERAERRLKIAGEKLEESSSAYSDGALIRASGLLETVRNELGFAEHQLSLVKDQHAELRAAEKHNAESVHKLRSRIRESNLLAEDRRTSQSTIDEIQSAGESLEVHISTVGKTDTDPFVLKREGDSLDRTFNRLQDGIRADWKAFDMAESSSTGAKAALTFCNSYLKEAQTDNIADSEALTRAIRYHAELTEEQAALDKQLEGQHEEWNEIHGKINELTAEVAQVRATLEHELSAAREAAQKLRDASTQISALNAWRSSYGVSPNRSSGHSSMIRAKQALARGDYSAARAAALTAASEALRAIQSAQAEESRKRAAAAARRRRSSYSSSSSFSSGSSFRSSSSSSSFSSSSFSSGSGFSRSGW